MAKALSGVLVRKCAASLDQMFKEVPGEVSRKPPSFRKGKQAARGARPAFVLAKREGAAERAERVLLPSFGLASMKLQS